MKAEFNASRSTGKFVRIRRPGPRIEVDCAEWTRQPAPRSSGQFVRVCETPPADSTGASPDLKLRLKLTIRATADADPSALYHKLVTVIESLHEYDRSLGGAGLRWETAGSMADPGTVSLILGPNDPTNAESRLQTLATLIRETVAEFQNVQTVSATIQNAA